MCCCRNLEAAVLSVRRIRSSSPGMNRLILKSFWLHKTSPFRLRTETLAELWRSNTTYLL